MKVRLPSHLSTSYRPLRSIKSASQCLHLRQPSTIANHPTSDPRWLSDMKARIGKCIMFGGLDSQAFADAGDALKILAEEWRELVAGREGFLVSPQRAGLLRHKIVWGEQDSMGHVNNVTYVRWAESARVNWTRNYAVHLDPAHKKEWNELCTPRGDGMILRSIKTDYKFPMKWPDHISVFHRLRNLPLESDSHFILDVVILSELRQRPAARCVEDIVMYDYQKGAKLALRPWMMNAFRKTWEEQEGAKRWAEERIKDVVSAVRRLETRTWDREGAVEDMGGTK